MFVYVPKRKNLALKHCLCLYGTICYTLLSFMHAMPHACMRENAGLLLVPEECNT